MLRNARSWQFEHSCFQSFACQCFGQAQTIVMSAIAVKLQDDRKVRMVRAPSIVSNPVETATIQKLRVRLLPFLFALYVVAFIDRINLGFAALTMNRELAITSQQFGFAAGIFFWGYFLFEIPSNLILHKIGARVWIARILITWGAVATLTGFVQSANQLYIARFALGLAEAGYFPGIVLYLGYWFRQRERAQAIALILMGMPLASVVGGPISGFILDHAHWFGLSSWRWLLILEGLPAAVSMFLTYFLLPSRLAEATFLTGEERPGSQANWSGKTGRSRGRNPCRWHGLWLIQESGIWHVLVLVTVSPHTRSVS